MKTILLVEDDEAFAYAATKAIEGAGYRVVTARTTMAGLQAIDADPSIDLLVTDIKMPPGQPHGFALANMAHQRRPRLPVIYVTAYPELAEHGDEKDRILRKPLKDHALVNEIKARLA
jgi:CheY-like chemotaxis protein